MRRFDSLVMRWADQTRVPAGDALAVDREGFSAGITETLEHHPLVEIVREEADAIPEGPVIIATGPLTSEKMASAIAQLPGLSTLNFYDAAAPIVYRESLDKSKMYRLSRYGRGDDYLNCPMTKEEYLAFYEALIHAESAPLHDFEQETLPDDKGGIQPLCRRADRRRNR